MNVWSSIRRGKESRSSARATSGLRLLLVAASLVTFAAAQAPYVNLTGTVQGPNGLPLANSTLSFTPTQQFFVAGVGTVVATTAQCATSVDGSTVSLLNPLNPPLTTTVFSGTLGAATYYVVIVWADAAGHFSLPSPEVIQQLVSTGSIKVSAPPSSAPANATAMRVYMGTSPGTETFQGSVSPSATYTRSTPLVSGAALPASNNSVCQIVANDAGWPSGTGYVVDITTPAGAEIPGYPMQWQLLGPGNTVNLSQGLPLYNGTVQFPSPIIATPFGHATQSISGGLSLGKYPFTAGSINSSTINGVLNPAACASSPPAWCSGTDIGAWTNAAIASIGCGEIYIASGTYTQTTTILKPRCVHLHGASGFGSTVLNFTTTPGCSIVIADNSGTSLYPPGAVEDLYLAGAGNTSNTCGIYMGGSDGSATAPTTIIDPAANYGDHASINRVLITQFGKGIQFGYNTWRDTVFESVITANGTGITMPAVVAASTLSGENITIESTSVQNSLGEGLFIGTGVQVNFNLVNTSFDFNGCFPGPSCNWQIQNGTAASQVSVTMHGGYITSADHWILNYGRFYASGNYVTGGQQSSTLGYLIDNENADNFTVIGGQWFNGGTGDLMNGAGQCSTWIGNLITGGGGASTSSPIPACTYIDRFGNPGFAGIISGNELRMGAAFATIKQGTGSAPTATAITGVCNAGSGCGWQFTSNNNGGGYLASGVAGTPSLNLGTHTGAVGAETYTQRGIFDASGFGVGNAATSAGNPFHVDMSGNALVNGNLTTNGTVASSGGSAVVYRCATAGATLPVGSLTISPGACGSTVDTGLRVH